MLRLTLFALCVSALVSCERSNRTIEVQPTAPSIKPSGDNTGGDSTTKTGSLTLTIRGLPSSATAAQLAISVGGDQESRSLSLSGGSGTTTLSGMPVGYASVKVSTTISGTYYSGTASASIVSNNEVTAYVSMTASQDPGPGPSPIPGPGPSPIPGPGPSPIPGPGPSPIPGPGPSPIPGPGGDTSIDIGIDIGGNPGPNPGPSNTWDGKTFKGNSMFNVEPMN